MFSADLLLHYQVWVESGAKGVPQTRHNYLAIEIVLRLYTAKHQLERGREEEEKGGVVSHLDCSHTGLN